MNDQEGESCVKKTIGCRWAPHVDHTCETGEAFKVRMHAKAWAEEERFAWDRYAAALLTTCDVSDSLDHEVETTYAADGADMLLEERRKRFGAGK